MAAVLLSNTMAQNHNSNANNDVKPTIFHDFLGRECPPVPNCATAGDASAAGSPSASASRANGPVSTTSDLGSDRQVGSHLEGVPFYGQRSDFSGSDFGNRYAGNKRSNSDSVFLGSSRPDFPDTSHLMKMLRNVGQEQPMRPILQGATVGNGKPDSIPSNSKWERAIPVNVGPVLQHPSRTGQGQPVPYPYQQTLSNRFKDPTMGTSVISQSAADEGSRTGIEGSGILNSVNVSGVGEPKHKSGISSAPEPGSSTPLRRLGSTPASRQMTIFYGGQAHVFDDVHPNKADAIMAMAGSSGGSWSTNFSQNPAIKPFIAIPENNTLPIRDIRRDPIPSIHGGHSGVLMTDARRPSRATEEKP